MEGEGGREYQMAITISLGIIKKRLEVLGFFYPFYIYISFPHKYTASFLSCLMKCLPENLKANNKNILKLKA